MSVTRPDAAGCQSLSRVHRFPHCTAPQLSYTNTTSTALFLLAGDPLTPPDTTISCQQSPQIYISSPSPPIAIPLPLLFGLLSLSLSPLLQTLSLKAMRSLVYREATVVTSSLCTEADETVSSPQEEMKPDTGGGWMLGTWRTIPPRCSGREKRKE